MVGACPQAPNKADHDGFYSFRRLGRTQEDDLGGCRTKHDEAMRDLGRLRAQAMRDLRKTRQQLLSFLLRLGSRSPYGHWTKMHRRWLGEPTFAHPVQHLAHEEMLQRIERAEALRRSNHRRRGRRQGRGGAPRRPHPPALARGADPAPRRLRLRPRGADGLVRGARASITSSAWPATAGSSTRSSIWPGQRPNTRRRASRRGGSRTSSMPPATAGTGGDG